MATPPSFPTLPGLAWPIKKTPIFSTRVASHSSGREVRAANYQYPLYQFELSIEALFDGADEASGFSSLGLESLQSLMGLFLKTQGQLGTFLYADPTDNSVVAQAIGQGNGSTVSFTFGRSIGGWSDPVGWVTVVSNVYVNGALQTAGTYNLVAPNVLEFNTAPPSGQEITADFSFAYVCRFLSDQNDFENIMQGLWQVKSIKFRSVKVNG